MSCNCGSSPCGCGTDTTQIPVGKGIKGDAGAPGPVGPAGATGATGPAGPAGSNNSISKTASIDNATGGVISFSAAELATEGIVLLTDASNIIVNVWSLAPGGVAKIDAKISGAVSILALDLVGGVIAVTIGAVGGLVATTTYEVEVIQVA